MWEWVHPLAAIATVIGALLTSVWYIAWFIARQLSALKDVVFVRIEKMQEVILNKLEYHERHDDRRFDTVHSDLNAIKLRNAARDGLSGRMLTDIRQLQEGQTIAQEESKSYLRGKTES